MADDDARDRDRTAERLAAEPITSVRTYLVAAAALLALALTTVLLAYAPIGPWHLVTALGIAALKAALIVLLFMHGRFSSGVIRIAVVAGLLWLGILLAGTLNDYLTRGWLQTPGK